MERRMDLLWRDQLDPIDSMLLAHRSEMDSETPNIDLKFTLHHKQSSIKKYEQQDTMTRGDVPLYEHFNT